MIFEIVRGRTFRGEQIFLRTSNSVGQLSGDSFSTETLMFRSTEHVLYLLILYT